MHKNSLLVVGITILFVGVGFTSSLGVNVERPTHPLNTGELAWWKSDECDGTTLWDCSHHDYHGTIYGADWTPGCCLVFDGVDDYVDFDNHSVSLGLNKTDDYIIMLRFKSTGSGMFYSMSHTNPERAYLNLMLNSDGKISVTIGDETGLFNLSTSGSYNDGDWHLVKMDFWGSPSNPTLEIWVDGELDGSITDWLPPMLNEDFLTAKMGRKSITSTDYFDGEIDDIKIYKTGPPPPPLILTITGPDRGKPRQELTFTFSLVNWYGDDWVCNIDWGDGNTERIGVFNESVAVSHVWVAQGTFIITAYAEDKWGMAGPSTNKQVTITRNKPLNFNFNHLKWRLNHILQGFISTEDNNDVKHETTVRIHRARGITPYTLKLTEKESDEIDRIFDNLKISLDSAETGEEIDEIYNDAVVSLYELGLFPKSMTVEEAHQLVTGNTQNPSVKSPSGNLETGDENFDCQIAGETSTTYMFDLDKPFWNWWVEFWRNFGPSGSYPCWNAVNLRYYKGKIGQISYGYLAEYQNGIKEYDPSNGWVRTNGSNGVVRWDGKFYGNIKSRFVYEAPQWAVWETVYIGVKNFEGLFIDRGGRHSPPPCYLGNAEHVSISYDKPPPP